MSRDGLLLAIAILIFYVTQCVLHTREPLISVVLRFSVLCEDFLGRETLLLSPIAKRTLVLVCCEPMHQLASSAYVYPALSRCSSTHTSLPKRVMGKRCAASLRPQSRRRTHDWNWPSVCARTGDILRDQHGEGAKERRSEGAKEELMISSRKP